MASLNDVLMSVRAPVGEINIAYEEYCIGRGLAVVHSKDNHQSFVIYTMFVFSDALKSMSISIPSSIDKFEEIVSPIDTIIRKNYMETCLLVSLREALLPKLMTG